MNEVLTQPEAIRIHLDAHVHVYPFYDIPLFLDSAVRNMPRQTASDIRVLCLAERSDCRFFEQLAQDEVRLPEAWTIVAWDPDGAVCLRRADGHDLWICAGRQMATRERIEICSTGSDVIIPDGLSLQETVEKIVEAGGIPTLNFAPGKWLGKRGKKINDLLRRQPTERVWIGVDTTLRPPGWPSGLLGRLKKRGNPVLAGSDPLPFSGEEKNAGMYSAVFSIPPLGDSPRLIASLKTAWMNPKCISSIHLQGRRNTWGGLLKRLRQHAKGKSE